MAARTHCEKVLALLQSRDGWVSHHELYDLGVIAHSRVSNLRKRGHVIDVRRVEDMVGNVTYQYRLLRAASSDDLVSPPLVVMSGGADGTFGEAARSTDPLAPAPITAADESPSVLHLFEDAA